MPTRARIVTVVDDMTGATVPAVDECPTCHAGPFAGETVPAAVAAIVAHVDTFHAGHQR